jgi:uncharacterized coiled-coil protein SlyX
MQAERAHFSRGAFLLAGFAVGTLARMVTNTRQAREITALKRTLTDVETRLAERDAAAREQMERVTARLDEHEARLNETPSTGQIVAAMDELLSKTMHSLNQRLSAQADSIELLKTTVAQTDGLLERVLESLDSLRQSAPENPE